jgi:acetyl-CoA carboxylase carboxyltransferase component
MNHPGIVANTQITETGCVVREAALKANSHTVQKCLRRRSNFEGAVV